MRAKTVGTILTLLLGCGNQAKDLPGFQGIVEQEERVLAFELAGRVREIPVTRGQSVAAGDVLARLDETLALATRDARQAELRVAQAQAELVRSGSRVEEIRMAEAQMRSAHERVLQVVSHVERERKLMRSGATQEATVEDLEAELKRAREEETALSERVRMLRVGSRPKEIEAQAFRVKSAEAALAVEALRLERHTLKADATSQVVDIHIEPGEVAGTGQSVVTIADTRRPFVDVFVPVEQITKIQIGARAALRGDGLANPLAGRVEHIAQSTEFTPRFVFSPRERPNLVIRVRIRIDDPDLKLRAGIPAFVTIVGS